MTTKLTAPQRRALEFAATYRGIVNMLEHPQTLISLRERGFIRTHRTWSSYFITEAGVAAIGCSEDWPLIGLVISQFILARSDYRMSSANGRIVDANDVSDYLDAAIELTRAELRVGLV